MCSGFKSYWDTNESLLLGTGELTGKGTCRRRPLRLGLDEQRADDAGLDQAAAGLALAHLAAPAFHATQPVGREESPSNLPFPSYKSFLRGVSQKGITDGNLVCPTASATVHSASAYHDWPGTSCAWKDIYRIREGSLKSFLLPPHHLFLLSPHLLLPAPALLLLPGVSKGLKQRRLATGAAQLR